MTDYQQKLIEYVMGYSQRTQEEAVWWLDEYCSGWRKPQQELEFGRAA